jgi:ribonuclease BN (tRNA processing enzyme)
VALRVQFLGSGDAFGSGGRLHACFHVTGGRAPFLVDCGASALIAMRRFGVDPSGIGLVLLSHLHGDHFGGIPFLVLDGQLVSRRSAPLTIAGPAGTEQRVWELMEAMFPGSAGARRRFELRVVELEPGRADLLDGLVVTPQEVRHPSGAPALALRIEGGDRVLAYSGDTEWTDALIDVARGADLFVAEGYFVEKRVPFHLDVATLRAGAERLGAKRTVLTHMSPDVLDRPEQVADFELAHDGWAIDV